MKKLTAFALAAIATSAFADKATFPYDVEMTTRISTNEVEVSDETVTLPGTATAANDTVAELNMSAVTFTAIDANEWNDFVAGIDKPAAMLAIKADGANTNWFGYSGSAWVQLTGPAIDLATTYDVKIGFDKTAGNKIRYSVKANGAESWTDLTSGGVAWLAQGSDAAAQLSAVVLKGTGSIASGALASGARGAYAKITGVDETFSFDYSNVIFKVAVDNVTYADKLKVTLNDGSPEAKVIEKDIVVGDNTFDFSGKNLVPGTTYECTIEVVKTDAPSMTDSHSEPVTLSATADWFGFDNGAFVKAAGDSNVDIVDNSIVAKDDSLPAVVTPTSESAANAKSTVDIAVDYTEAFAETAQYDNAQSALALTSEGWKCLNDGDWVAITNDNVSTAAGVYATRAEFDYTGENGKVSFSVKQGDGLWNKMAAVDGGATEFQLAGTSNKLNGTSFVGSGKISAIAATYTSTGPIPPTVDGSEITLAGSTDVKLNDVNAGEYTISSTAGKKFSMKWSDADGKYAKIENGKLKVIGGTPANGIGSYDSYALGLDPESATSKPVLDSVQNAATDKLTMKVANVVPKTEVADVTMKLVTMDAPDATTGTETPIAAGDGVQIDLPSGVKYYKVKISIKTK